MDNLNRSNQIKQTANAKILDSGIKPVPKQQIDEFPSLGNVVLN